MERCTAPWTDTQVRTLNRRQRQGGNQPYTCPNDHLIHHVQFDPEQVPVADGTDGTWNVADAINADQVRLVADNDGWWCPADMCDYTQDWTHRFTLTSP